MAENKKYVELLWAEKYDKYEKGEKIPIEKPNLPFQVVETVNKPRIKGGFTAPLFPEDQCSKITQKTGRTFSSGVITSW